MKRDESDCLLPGLPASPSPSTKRTQDEAAMIHAVDSRSSISDFCTHFAQNGSSGRMCQASLLPTGEKILEPSSGSWGNAGMGGPIEFLTLVTSESPRNVKECSLSDILEEIGDVPPQCFLTDHSRRRIAERLDKYAKNLPETVPGVVYGWTGDETPKIKENCSLTLRASQGGEGAGVWFPEHGDDSRRGNGKG